MKDLNAIEVQEKQRDIRKAIKVLEAHEKDVLLRCTHKNPDGTATTRPTGGGFAMCNVCNAEID